MTTVAYRDGVLAADSRSTDNGILINDREVKLKRLRDGRLVARCGAVNQTEMLTDWLKIATADKPPRPELNEGKLVVVERDGRVRVFEDTGSYYEQARFAAWGSGAVAALTAMHLGCSAVEAVKVACKVDVYSGGRVRSLTLPDRHRTQRKRR